QGGLAQGVRGDRPGMDRDAAVAVTALGDGDTLAELGCLGGGALAARTRADDEKIELHGPEGFPNARLARMDPRGQSPLRCSTRSRRSCKARWPTSASAAR